MSKAKKMKHREGMVENPGIGERIADIVIKLVLAGICFLCIIPFWHVLMSSLSDGQLLQGHDGIVWKWVTKDGGVNLGGYEKTFTYGNYAILRSYVVTLMYVVGNILAGLVLNIISAYVIYRGPKLAPVFMLFLVFTTMFSGGVVPTYMVVQKLGLVGTPLSLILPGCTNAMFTILVLNAFRQVPEATVESAEIDGAGHFTIMFKIMLPQAMGLVTVTIINTAVLAWNAWFEASIYVPTQKEWWPLQLWIKQMVADNADILSVAQPDWNKYLVSFCVIMIATLPVLIAMPFAQKQLQKGALVGGVKG